MAIVSGTHKTNKTCSCFCCCCCCFKYPQNKSQSQEAHIFPVRHLPWCYEAGSRDTQHDGQQHALAQDEEGLLQHTTLQKQQGQTYILRLALVENLAEHAAAHRKAHPFCKRHFLLQQRSLAFQAGHAHVFALVALEKPQHICRMGYPTHRHLVQIPKSLTMFGLSNSAMRAASLWKSACMSADASSFSIFTATMVKGSYGSSPGALRERKTQVKGASTPNAGSVSGVKWWRQKQGGSIRHWPKDWFHQEWKMKIFYMKMLKEPPFPHAAQWWHWHIWLLSENK